MPRKSKGEVLLAGITVLSIFFNSCKYTAFMMKGILGYKDTKYVANNDTFYT